ncbi:unnamed protein product [Paramecium pentaurelia]|uniref:Uncharacterized protein n=1 Tax=Paramecium pentaurelia TaxID=43138 RepID=A0A8S1UXU9_9CILI|nr:unnamed protein product [Paramecium pentaurelia]
MIHKNVVFGNHITANKLERLVKKQKILLKSSYDTKETKNRKICKSKSFKFEIHPRTFQETHNSPLKNQIQLELPSERSPIRLASSKPILEFFSRSQKSMTSLQLKNTIIANKLQRRWSNYELISEKQKRLNNKAPKSVIKYQYLMAVKAKKKKIQRMKMQYKFLGKKNNKVKKTRSKTQPLDPVIKMRHKRAQTEIKEYNEGLIFPLEHSLIRKIVKLIMMKKTAVKRQTCFQIPKGSMLLSKEKLIRFQQQINEKLVSQSESESQIDGSPCLDSLRAYQRRVNFEEKKFQIKIMSRKKKNLIKALQNKQTFSIINSYVSNKAKTQNSIQQQSFQNSLHQKSTQQTLCDFMSKQGDRLTTFHSTHEQPQIQQKTKRSNMLTKLFPYLQPQKNISK